MSNTHIEDKKILIVFSWEKAKKRSLATKLRRAKHMAKDKVNPTFNIQHPDETRDAQRKDFTQLEKRIKDDFQKHSDRVEAKRSKLT